MAVDQRSKNVKWQPADENGHVPSWERVGIAVLLDLRDELQEMNRHLSGIERQVLCSNATAIPRILHKIEENTQRKSRAKKVP